MASKNQKLLAGVTATGAGSWVAVIGARGIVVTHDATGTVDLTVAIQGKDADGNPVTLDSVALSAVGETVVQVPVGFTDLRANVTAYTDGTLTSYLNAA